MKLRPMPSQDRVFQEQMEAKGGRTRVIEGFRHKNWAFFAKIPAFVLELPSQNAIMKPYEQDATRREHSWETW